MRTQEEEEKANGREKFTCKILSLQVQVEAKKEYKQKGISVRQVGGAAKKRVE